MSLDSRELPGAPDPATAGASPLRVLLVEDNDDLRELLAAGLRLQGWTVRTAAGGEEALALLASGERPDVIVADLGLPGMDGREFLRRVRRMPGLGSTPAVALTGFGDPAEIAASLAAGFRDHVVKPVELDDLVERIRRVLAPGGEQGAASGGDAGPVA